MTRPPDVRHNKTPAVPKVPKGLRAVKECPYAFFGIHQNGRRDLLVWEAWVSERVVEHHAQKVAVSNHLRAVHLCSQPRLQDIICRRVSVLPRHWGILDDSAQLLSNSFDERESR